MSTAELPVKWIAIVFVLLIGITVLAATGLVNIPVLSSLLGADKPRDLGVKADPALFTALLAKENVKITGDASDYDLAATIRYGSAQPMDATVSSEELTSMMQATNNEKGPLKNLQVKLLDNNEMEMSANADLGKLGYPIKGPVYLKGTFEKGSSSSVSLNVKEGSFGLMPVPADLLAQTEDGIEQAINKQLGAMPGLRIDTLAVDDGQLHFTGAFPSTATAN